MRRLPTLVALVLVFAPLALGACGGDGLDATFEVTFDGDKCVGEGPGEVPPGEITVPLVNDSDLLVFPYVRRLEAGYTWQDWLDAYPPGEWNANANVRERWIHDVPYLGSALEQGITLPHGDTMSKWQVGVDTEEGQHEIHLAELNEGLWGCTGFVVT